MRCSVAATLFCLEREGCLGFFSFWAFDEEREEDLLEVDRPLLWDVSDVLWDLDDLAELRVFEVAAGNGGSPKSHK